MRSRLLAFLFIVATALGATASAQAYPWPVKPFFRQHPIRANFGDPRTLFDLSIFDNGMLGPGSFTCHNGIDIAAPDGTPVYAVMSGTVHMIDAEALAVDTGQGRTFQYFHIDPVVFDGEAVIAQKTVLGYIHKGFGHVHLSELRGFRIWNPLAKGGIAPYRDRTRPIVSSIAFRSPTALQQLDPLAICGRVSVVADAFDRPSIKIPGAFAGFPIAPALVTWTLRRIGTGAVVSGPTTVADFRGTLPAASSFWSVYARGTYQNAPRFGVRQFGLMPGRYLFNLTPSDFDTRTLANGVYEITVRASDIKGNAGTLSQRFTVVNQGGSETGCPPTHH